MGPERNGASPIPQLDLVKLYRLDATQTPLLSHEEEIDLAKRIEKGQDAAIALTNGVSKKEKRALAQSFNDGLQAADTLILANTRLVMNLANKKRGNGVEFTDLVQEGNTGLIRALKKFDYRKGNRFSTHATWWVWEAINTAISKNGRLIKAPKHILEKITEVRRARNILEQKLGREPHSDEIAEELNFKPEEMTLIEATDKAPVSLDRPIFEDGGTMDVFFEDKNEPTPDIYHEQKEIENSVRELLDTLTIDEARVISYRFGINGKNYLTLREVGAKMDLDPETVSQIEEKALIKLKVTAEQDGLGEYLR